MFSQVKEGDWIVKEDVGTLYQVSAGWIATRRTELRKEDKFIKGVYYRFATKEEIELELKVKEINTRGMTPRQMEKLRIQLRGGLRVSDLNAREKIIYDFVIEKGYGHDEELTLTLAKFGAKEIYYSTLGGYKAGLYVTMNKLITAGLLPMPTDRNDALNYNVYQEYLKAHEGNS